MSDLNYLLVELSASQSVSVGEACQKWSTIYRHTPRGLYLSINDKGKWFPYTAVRVFSTLNHTRTMAHQFQRSEFFSIISHFYSYSGSIRQILDNYPLQDINTIVFTDGERILGENRNHNLTTTPVTVIRTVRFPTSLTPSSSTSSRLCHAI